jgi:hypothetical protein
MAILPPFRRQGETRNEGRREQFHFRKALIVFSSSRRAIVPTNNAVLEK